MSKSVIYFILYLLCFSRSSRWIGLATHGFAWCSSFLVCFGGGLFLKLVTSLGIDRRINQGVSGRLLKLMCFGGKQILPVPMQSWKKLHILHSADIFLYWGNLSRKFIWFTSDFVHMVRKRQLTWGSEDLSINISQLRIYEQRMRMSTQGKGVLVPGTSHTRPSAWPPINMSGNLLVHVSSELVATGYLTDQ